MLLTSQPDQYLISLHVSGLTCILSLVYRKKKVQSTLPQRRVLWTHQKHVYYNRVRADWQREKRFFMLRAMVLCHHVLSVMRTCLTGIRGGGCLSWKVVQNAGWSSADSVAVPAKHCIQSFRTVLHRISIIRQRSFQEWSMAWSHRMTWNLKIIPASIPCGCGWPGLRRTWSGWKDSSIKPFMRYLEISKNCSIHPDHCSKNCVEQL